MSAQLPIRIWFGQGVIWLCSMAACIAASGAGTGLAQGLPAQTPPAQETQAASPAVLDRVVAVVNNHVILASDLDENIRLSILDPNQIGQGAITRERALQQLISRTLIEQQIQQQGEDATEPSQDDVDARLAEIRKDLPACVHENCASDAGWKAFLAAHGLTPQQVDAYLRAQIEILRFIEQRFRAGIRISSQQIEAYYNDTLLPQYRKGETVPPLDAVASRIEEILLQQQVNVLFDDWLDNLRKQGDVEVLDPALEPAASQDASPKRGNE